MTTVYKVVYVNVEFMLYYMQSTGMLSSVKYRLGYTTKPPITNSLLFCFDTYENALEYRNKLRDARIDSNYLILECLAEEVTPFSPPDMDDLFKECSGHPFIYFWSLSKEEQDKIGRLNIKGSMGAKSITPIKIMEE